MNLATPARRRTRRARDADPEPFAAAEPRSAPVAIILALALAATVGVSAQSWDATRSRPAVPVAASPGTADTVTGSLVRLLFGWLSRDAGADCPAAPR